MAPAAPCHPGFGERLTRPEVKALNRSQFATGSQKHRDPRFPRFAFTEHGAIMAATILNSARAVEMSLYVLRAFVRLRELLASNSALARKLDELERKHRHHDQSMTAILAAIRELTHLPPARRRGAGFVCRRQIQLRHLSRRPQQTRHCSCLTFRRSFLLDSSQRLDPQHSPRGWRRQCQLPRTQKDSRSGPLCQRGLQSTCL